MNMKLVTQRRIAAGVMKCGEHRVWFDPQRLEEIKQAITRNDISHLINDFAIQKRPSHGISHSRFRKRLMQKRKGRQRGMGSRKGKKGARLSRKKEWTSRMRIQRAFLRHLRNTKIISPTLYHILYKKSKGGFFRSKRHIQYYLEEHKAITHETEKKTRPSSKKA